MAKVNRLLDPVFRHERAVKAGKASRRAAIGRAQPRMERYASKLEAHQAGYHLGYNRAYYAWKRWALEALETQRISHRESMVTK